MIGKSDHRKPRKYLAEKLNIDRGEERSRTVKSYQHVADCIQRDELVKFTQELIRINSVFDPEKTGFNEMDRADEAVNSVCFFIYQ
jgi:hypothetical protein